MENTNPQYNRTEPDMLEPWEVEYYTFNFDCTEEELNDALKQVGSYPSDLRNRLSK